MCILEHVTHCVAECFQSVMVSIPYCPFLVVDRSAITKVPCQLHCHCVYRSRRLNKCAAGPVRLPVYCALPEMWWNQASFQMGHLGVKLDDSYLHFSLD